jgi:ABC-type transport system involved in multi-copper enzyme maturation permease subunit
VTDDLRAPSPWHVMRAIARRELGIALRRKLVRLLFLGSVGPPLVFGIVLVVRLLAEKAMGADLGWDPVLRFLQVQSFPVALLALGLGTPLVALDRSEDVLYLYAVRPVSPWHYAVGKMLAVAFPSLFLLLIPGILIAMLRQGLMPDVATGDSLLLVGKVALAALFLAVAYAGVSVGPSAATKRARWALLIAISFFWIPDAAAQLVWRGNAYALGPGNAAEDLLSALFGDAEALRGWLSALVLGVYAVAGAWITMFKVRKEMTP